MASEFDIVAEEAINIGLEDLQQELEEMVKPSANLVKEAGQKFIKDYELAQARYRELLQMNNKKKSRHLKQWAELEMVRESFDKFQNAINAFYNQLVKVMYVYMDPETGKVILSIEENDPSLLQVNKNYKNVQYHLDQLKTIFKQDDYDSTILDATEQSIYARWQVARQVSGNKSNRYLPILWKINGVWGGAKVNNLGTIAEAYVNFYLAKFKFSGKLEEDVREYITNNQLGAASVDNMSGFLIGDTSALNNKIQFAVKKDTASPMNMHQVYNEVKMIINDTNPEEFVNLLYSKFTDTSKAKQNQVKALSSAIEKTCDNLIQQGFYKNIK